MTYANMATAQAVGQSYSFESPVYDTKIILFPTTSSYSAVKNIDEAVKSIINKITEIEHLGDNWNGYSASPISSSIIAEVKSMISQLKKIPEIFPTADGQLQLEYDKKDGSYLEMDISGQDFIDVFMIDKNGNEKEYRINKSTTDINKTVETFYGY